MNKHLEKIRDKSALRITASEALITWHFEDNHKGLELLEEIKEQMRNDGFNQAVKELWPIVEALGYYCVCYAVQELNAKPRLLCKNCQLLKHIGISNHDE